MTEDPLLRVLTRASVDASAARAGTAMSWWGAMGAEAVLAAIPPDTADAMRAGLLLTEAAAARRDARPLWMSVVSDRGAWTVAAGSGATLSAPGATLAAALSDLLARLGDGR